MLADHAALDRVQELAPVTAIGEVLAAQEAMTRVHASERLRHYVVAVLEQTRVDERTELGASPRAGLMLLRASMARAALEGRDHVLPDDVQELAEAVLAHRLLLAPTALESERPQIIADALDRVPAL
jgi:MoxR-like ATPase